MSDRMRKVTIAAVPAHEQAVVDGQNCDRCGADIPPGGYFRREFTLEWLTGWVYPEGGSMEGWRLPDCCDSCAEVLKELLLANRFKVVPAEKEW